MTGAIVVLTLVGLVAAIGPARRAARLDPMLSLRAEQRLHADACDARTGQGETFRNRFQIPTVVSKHS